MDLRPTITLRNFTSIIELGIQEPIEAQGLPTDCWLHVHFPHTEVTEQPANFLLKAVGFLNQYNNQ